MTVLRRYRLHSAVFGLLTFCIPMGLGLLVGHYLLGYDWLTTILLASTFATPRFLRERIKNRPS